MLIHKIESDIHLHPTALCESECVGRGTRVWAFAHVMADAEVGRDCNICGHVFIESGAQVGSRVTIKNNVSIWNGVTLEDDVFVGPGVIFTNDKYPRSPRSAAAIGRYEHVENWLAMTIVRKGATLGAGAIVLPGITVGRYAMIAAGAVITHDVPDFAMMVGNPAQMRGWACMCGRPMGDARACCHCRRKYVDVDGHLEVDQADRA